MHECVGWGIEDDGDNYEDDNGDGGMNLTISSCPFWIDFLTLNRE